MHRKAQQARQGGGREFLDKVVTAARKSISLRRRMSTNQAQQRKLALTLEIFAENSACYGHYVQVMPLLHNTPSLLHDTLALLHDALTLVHNILTLLLYAGDGVPGDGLGLERVSVAD
jgi:hypothetical protein